MPGDRRCARRGRHRHAVGNPVHRRAGLPRRRPVSRPETLRCPHDTRGRRVRHLVPPGPRRPERLLRGPPQPLTRAAESLRSAESPSPDKEEAAPGGVRLAPGAAWVLLRISQPTEVTRSGPASLTRERSVVHGLELAGLQRVGRVAVLVDAEQTRQVADRHLAADAVDRHGVVAGLERADRVVADGDQAALGAVPLVGVVLRVGLTGLDGGDRVAVLTDADEAGDVVDRHLAADAVHRNEVVARLERADRVAVHRDQGAVLADPPPLATVVVAVGLAGQRRRVGQARVLGLLLGVVENVGAHDGGQAEGGDGRHRPGGDDLASYLHYARFPFGFDGFVLVANDTWPGRLQTILSANASRIAPIGTR